MSNMSDTKIETKKAIILYDGVCNLCNGTMSFLTKIDSHKILTMIPLQSDQAKQFLNRFSLNEKNLSSVIFVTGDTLYLKSSAVLHILKELKNVWSLAYVFIIIPRPVRDFFYGLIAKYRYRLFGTSATCSVGNLKSEA